MQSVSSAAGLHPAEVNAIQTFGDFLGYNPHCHMLAADGGFHGNGALTVAPAPDGEQISELPPARAQNAAAQGQDHTRAKSR